MRLSLILRLLTLRFFGKIKRQALLGNLNNNNAASNKSNGELATSEKVEAAPVEVKKPKKMDAGDGDVDIGDEMPMSTSPMWRLRKIKKSPAVMLLVVLVAPAIQVVIPRRLVIQIQRVPQRVIMKHGQCAVFRRRK
ncbi:uncharacterized protein LOC110265723 [Arachis ipaensis]|uniref:uncharacterized protein LOC110265723 n=1 Tax=Arachis ipaensis TaxID=130454 RepID=UPI000A2B96FB|nr:uncharacterized protein LOC110265723 [Arachis ipaensis]